MSQKCSECGRETQFGEPLKHYPGCEHWRQPGDWQGRMHREYLNGPFNQQANSHGAGVAECGGCGNSDPDKRCLGCLHDFGSRRDNKAGVEFDESN